MALPDLRRLAIGTHPPIGAPWDVDVAALIAYQQIYERIGAPEKHPQDALKVYDAMCRASASGAADFRAATAPAFLVTREIYDAFKNHKDLCRDVLIHVFRAYGWTEWLRVVDSNARSSFEINKRRCLNPALESLATLRALAELHAACYVRDDEAKDVTLSGNPGNPVRVVIVEHVRNRGPFVADVELLRFEYVTSKLRLAWSMAEGEAYSYDMNDDVSRWNPRSLSDASGLFMTRLRFEGNGVDKWTMTALKNADYMFMSCEKFNADLALWNPVSLRSAEGMFADCRKFEGQGLDKWAKGWAKKLSNAHGMFFGCDSLDFSNLRNWKLPNYKLDATNMFCRTTISKDQAKGMADLMKINTRGTEQNMAKIESDVFKHELWPIYSSGDDTTNPVASADKLDPKNPWHVAGVIFGQNEHCKHRGPCVMAWLANAVQKWQAEFPAES